MGGLKKRKALARLEERMKAYELTVKDKNKVNAYHKPGSPGKKY